MSYPPPTELDTVAIHPLARSQTQLFSSPTEEELDEKRPSTSTVDILGNNRSSLESTSHGAEAAAATVVAHSIDDDAITRHQKHSSGPQQQEQQQQTPHHQQPEQQQRQHIPDGEPSHSPPITTRVTRSRTLSTSRPRVSVDYSVPSFRLSKADLILCVDQSEAVCEIHDHHGLRAIDEEEAALEHSAALTAAKHAASLSQQQQQRERARAYSLDLEDGEGARSGGGCGGGVGNGFGMCKGPGSCFCCLPPRHNNVIPVDSGAGGGGGGQGGGGGNGDGANQGGDGDEDNNNRHEEVEEEDDHFLSGICLPRSQFFQTSVICSNTMARDALANERTFLSWLNVSVALCLVSFTFISKSLSLDSLREMIGEEKELVHKDRLSIAVGYVCFIVAFLSAIYSALKYLRNIRRISTRYPFARAGAWTFTFGMIIGIVIMVVLVLTYTNPLL